MAFFDPQHLSYGFVFVPAVIIAEVINLDNRYCGPYFAVVDVVFNEFGTGYNWYDREILWAFTRRIIYLLVSGMILRLCDYRLHDIAATFFVVGFLSIWPAFPPRPLPVYVSKKGWHVWLVWTLYAIGIVAFGMLGATVLSPHDLVESLVSVGLGLGATAFRIPLQRSLQQGRTRAPGSEERPSGNPRNGQDD